MAAREVWDDPYIAKRRYKRGNRIELMFSRLQDWRRLAAPYDRCPSVFSCAIALAATVIF